MEKNFVKAFKENSSKRTLREVWLGGGGNDGVCYQEMTRDWVENKFYLKRRQDLGNWNECKRWTKVFF